jgi:hypothetical protein
LRREIAAALGPVRRRIGLLPLLARYSRDEAVAATRDASDEAFTTPPSALRSAATWTHKALSSTTTPGQTQPISSPQRVPLLKQ